MQKRSYFERKSLIVSCFKGALRCFNFPKMLVAGWGHRSWARCCCRTWGGSAQQAGGPGAEGGAEESGDNRVVVEVSWPNSKTGHCLPTVGQAPHNMEARPPRALSIWFLRLAPVDGGHSRCNCWFICVLVHLGTRSCAATNWLETLGGGGMMRWSFYHENVQRQ